MSDVDRFIFGAFFLGTAAGMLIGISSVFVGPIPIVSLALPTAFLSVLLAPSRREMDF